MVDLYNNQNPILDIYNVSGKSVTGADIRKALHKILYTDKQGTDIIYRRAQLDNRGLPIKCECTKNNRSQEADKDIECNQCSGLGYYYNDILTKTYMNHSQAYAIYKKFKNLGDSQVEYKTTYFEWDFIKNALDDGDNIPNRFDRIIEVKKDLAGNLISPLTAREIYEILSVEPYRLDSSGRIEYYRVRIISVVDKSFLV